MDQASQLPGTKRTRARSQTIAGIGLFAALAIVLNFTHIQVPAPYAQFLIYEFWEIPTVVCLLIFGLFAALTASLINTIVLLLVNPGATSFGPIYNFIAVAVSLVAIVLANKLCTEANFAFSAQVLIATGLAIVVRSAVMTVVNYALLPFPPPLGIPIPEKVVVPLLPLIAFFNATLVLYTVPIGYTAARAATSRVHFALAYPLQRMNAKN